VFDALDRVLADAHGPRHRAAAALLWRLPLALRHYLSLRGAIEVGARMCTLNEALALLAKSPYMQARLRARDAERAPRRAVLAPLRWLR
jgi:hypothetical protein